MTPERARHLLARAAIGGSGGAPCPSIVVDDDDVDLLSEIARVGRVVPAWGRMVSERWVEVGDDRVTEVFDAWASAMAHALLVEEHLVWLAGELADRGVEFRVLKGPASARLDHDRPEARQFGDLDVLVRPEAMSVVIGLLELEGWRRRYPEPRAGFDREFTKSVGLRGPIEIDVHRTIVDRPIGARLPVADLWQASESFKVAGRRVEALGQVDRFVHACLHGELGPPPMRLSTMSDIGSMLTAGTLDPTAVWNRAVRWGVEPVVAAAVERTVATVWWPAGLDDRWSRDVEASVVDTVYVASQRRGEESSALRSMLAVGTVPGLRRKAAYVASLVAPRRRVDDGRARRWDERYRSAWDQVAQWWRGP
jgi:hypothetical protein